MTLQEEYPSCSLGIHILIEGEMNMRPWVSVGNESACNVGDPG